MTGLVATGEVALLAMGVNGLLGRISRRYRPPDGTFLTLAAGFGIAYLLMPTIHHLLGTDGYFYISGRDNFFARSNLLQVVTWLVAWGIVVGLNGWRKQLLLWQGKMAGVPG